MERLATLQAAHAQLTYLYSDLYSDPYIGLHTRSGTPIKSFRLRRPPSFLDTATASKCS